MPPMGGGSPQQMQDMLSQMMSSPAVQSMMANPDNMRNMLQSMPQVRQVQPGVLCHQLAPHLQDLDGHLCRS